MTAILIISIFLLAFASYTVIRTKRSASLKETHYGRLPTLPVNLFGDASDGQLPGHAGDNTDADGLAHEERQHAALLRARAAQRDHTALLEAMALGGEGLYEEVLDTLVAEAIASGRGVDSLSSFVAGNGELRAASTLAAAVLEAWRSSPDAASTARTLHVAALSDDAAMFQRAVETIWQARREGRLVGLTDRELLVLFESEYWVLDADARRSGAGFVLKQMLADMRRQLQEDATRPTPFS